MAVSVGDRLGWAGLIMGAIGVGLTFLFPDRKWIGWLFLGFALILGFTWAGVEFRSLGRSNPIKSSLAVGITIGLIAGCAWFFWMTRAVDIYDAAYLHEAPRQEFIEITTKLAHDMIDFETKNRNDSEEFDEETARQIRLTPRDLEKLKQLTSQRSVLRLRNDMKYRAEYRKTFLGHANAVRTELLFRLRLTPQQADERVMESLPPSPFNDSREMTLAFSGELAGPFPIAEAAHYLETLARLLQ